MNIIIETILPYLIPSLIGFLISLLVTEYCEKDYTKIITVILIILIGFAPLIILIFFEGNFNLPFYQKIMIWGPGFLAGNIVDVIFHPIFFKIMEN